MKELKYNGKNIEEILSEIRIYYPDAVSPWHNRKKGIIWLDTETHYNPLYFTTEDVIKIANGNILIEINL